MTPPSHCLFCGAYLMGGATKHGATCPMLALIVSAYEIEDEAVAEDEEPQQGRTN